MLFIAFNQEMAASRLLVRACWLAFMYSIGWLLWLPSCAPADDVVVALNLRLQYMTWLLLLITVISLVDLYWSHWSFFYSSNCTWQTKVEAIIVAMHHARSLNLNRVLLSRGFVTYELQWLKSVNRFIKASDIIHFFFYFLPSFSPNSNFVVVHVYQRIKF